MKMFVFCLILLLAGCAEYRTQAANETQWPPATVISQKELKNLEKAFYMLDEPLAHFYHLANRYSDNLEKYLSAIKEERPEEKLSLIGQGRCFQAAKELFRQEWRNIYDSPESAADKAEELLLRVNKMTVLMEESLEILDSILSEIKSKNIWI